MTRKIKEREEKERSDLNPLPLSPRGWSYDLKKTLWSFIRLENETNLTQEKVMLGFSKDVEEVHSIRF